MTRSRITYALVVAFLVMAWAGCKSDDKQPTAGPATGKGDDSGYRAEPVDPRSIPEDYLKKMLKDAPEKTTGALMKCVVLTDGEASYTCCASRGHMICGPPQK